MDCLSIWIPTREFVYMHSVIRQKYINRRCINAQSNKENITSACSPPKLRTAASTTIHINEIDDDDDDNNEQ